MRACSPGDAGGRVAPGAFDAALLAGAFLGFGFAVVAFALVVLAAPFAAAGLDRGLDLGLG